jgi:3-isopropylmalate/(R)-2-methylmalate dehydratase small subunit
MEPVKVISGKVSVLDRADVDTDQIIPKQFLKRVERTGFGEFLFYDWKQEDGWDLPPNPILATGPELRLRLEPRARPVGARGLRLQGRRRRLVRGHLLHNCTKIGLLPVVLPRTRSRR